MRQYIDIRDCVASGVHGMDTADVRIESGGTYSLTFAKQKTGYGEKVFLVCPICGSMREKLYILGDSLLCRDCYPLPIYRDIKNVSVGSSTYIKHRMQNLAKKEGIALKRLPFCYMEYEKPKYRHFEKWHMAITKLQALENMRFQAIFLRKRYSLKVINSIFEEKNFFLYTLELYDMDRYICDWDIGYMQFPGNRDE